MKLKNGEFETEIKEGLFCISIKQESDLSLDGGYTFEDVTNECGLNKLEAMMLIDNLKEYIEGLS